VAGALLCVASPVMAQTVLSEADVLARLSGDSPRARAIRAAVDVVNADVAMAGRWPNPRATYNRESVAGVTEHIVTVSQPLPITGRRGFEIGAASALADAASRRADDAIRQARAEVRAAFADLVSAQVRESELARAVDRLRDVVDVITRRERAGDAAGYDRLRAERELTDLEADLAGARADRASAQATLGSFFSNLGDATSLVVAVPPAPSRAALATVQELVGRAQATRGEALALQHEIDAAHFNEQAAARRLLPEPEIVAGTKSSNAAGGDLGSVISVHATVPLFDRSHPERARARAQAARAEAELAVFNTTIRARITALRALVIERRDAADRYRASATSTADLERIAQVSYDSGETGILQLLDAYRSAASVRARQAALDAAARQAEIELEFVSGWEMQ
jgi:cobalt-zinc-cadmium efflux system outer membrane protein